LNGTVVYQECVNWTFMAGPLIRRFDLSEEMLMTSLRTCTAIVVSLGWSVFGSSQRPHRLTTDSFQSDEAAKTSTFTQSLPSLQGDQLKITLVEVTYAPGSSSPPHSHPCPVVGHVIEGTVRMGVKGEPERTYGVGESFYEQPNGVHLVSANASSSRPAKFIAFFVCDRDTPLSVGVPGAPGRNRE
jgi:quercetin dioxygenase-like cupin family protein